jgi:methyl-accepting chemotaxis protein
MKLMNKFTLTTRLTLTIVACGLLPALVIGLLAYRTAGHMAEDIGQSYESAAEGIADKIDRNLFERYGDVQAFGANEAVNDTKSWYQVGSEKNKLAAVANRYANLYGCYPLSIIVDLEGKVIAVNDKDPAGKSINTAELYQKSYKDAEWFKESLAGRFTKSDSLDGTFVQDLHVDEDVRRAYNSDGLVLGFSAPIKDASGKTIGVWHNAANFSLVEEILGDAYKHLKADGLERAELMLIDSKGRVLADYDPSGNGHKDSFVHDPNVILKPFPNGAEYGAVRDVLQGKHGHLIAEDPRKHHTEVVGYAVCNGELGFSGLKWGVLVQVPEEQALGAMHRQTRQILLTIALSVAALIGLGAWLGRSISNPLIRGIAEVRSVGCEVASASTQFAGSSQTVAEAASEQAASLEETSASLEEIGAMTKRNADNSATGKSLSQQARDSANTGLDRINEMGRTLTSIKTAVGQMESAVSEMQSSSQEIAKIIKTIDEIAFQTNLLALNAAVEAARAGEAGMGFAVVADEVRSLAQRSAQAAKDTSEKIEAAVKRSELGGVASKKVVASLGEVEVNARGIEQVFQGIVGQIKSLDELVGEISAASREQSQGIGEVNMAVSQMDKVTQSNAASAEENASAAEELNQQVDALQKIVGGLELIVTGGGNGHKAAPEPEPDAAPAPTPKRAPARPRAQKASHAPYRTNGSSNGNGNGNGHAVFDIPMPEPVGAGSRDGFKDF